MTLKFLLLLKKSTAACAAVTAVSESAVSEWGQMTKPENPVWFKYLNKLYDIVIKQY